MGHQEENSGERKMRPNRRSTASENKVNPFKKFGNFMKKGSSSTSVPDNGLKVLPDLEESDPAQEPPPKLDGTVLLKRHKKRRIIRNKRYFAKLNRGILKLYVNNGQQSHQGPAVLAHEFKIDLSQVTILYDDNARRLLITFKLESHQLVPENKDNYIVWKEAMHRHRLYRQDQARQGLAKDSDHSLKHEYTNIQQELANAKKNGVTNGEDKKYSQALDALTRAMEEYQNVHTSVMETVQEIKKIQELSKLMFTEIKGMWIDIRGGLTTTTTSNYKVSDALRTELSKMDTEPDAKTARQDFSSEEDEDDDEEDVSHVQETLPDKSLKSLEATRTKKRCATKEEVMSPDGRQQQLPAPALAAVKAAVNNNVDRPPQKKIKVEEPLPANKPIQKPPIVVEKQEKSQEARHIPPAVVAIPEKPQPPPPQPQVVQQQQPVPVPPPPPPKVVEKPAPLPPPQPPPKPPRIHREILPAQQMPGESISLAVIATAAMKGTLPISTYEPLGMLQVLCEELRFVPQTINRALSCPDALDRMCFVAAFAMSAYSAMIGRNRKPFNPLLGETFDYASEDGWKYHAEQVAHHPATSAVAAVGKNFEWWQTATGAAKTNAWSGTVEVTPELPVRLRLNLGNCFEEYTWNKVKTIIQNATAAPENRVIKNEGTMVIKSSSGVECKLVFKGDKCCLSGEAKDRKAGTSCKLVGRWDKGLNKVIGDEQEGLFEVPPRDPISRNYYGFSKFTMTLNELFPEDKPLLPATDSRFRPDQRFLENGDGPKAMQAKQALESEQRQRTKTGKTAKAIWFDLRNDDCSKKAMWISSSQYWISKEKGFRDQYSQANITHVFG